jgi:hypothetical protein
LTAPFFPNLPFASHHSLAFFVFTRLRRIGALAEQGAGGLSPIARLGELHVGVRAEGNGLLFAGIAVGKPPEL